MKKSDIFNVRFPSPADRWVYPIYHRFIALQQELAKNWVHEVVSGRLGERNYQDILDIRTTVTKNGALAVRIKPLVGFESEEALQVFVKFFDMYKAFSFIAFKIARDVQSISLLPLPSDAKELEHYRKFVRESTKNLHITVMMIKLLVALMNREVLEFNDIIELHETMMTSTTQAALDSLHQIARDKNAEDLITYYDEDVVCVTEHNDRILVEAYWDYARNNPTAYEQSDFMLQQ